MNVDKGPARRRAQRLAIRVGGSLSGRSSMAVTIVDLSLTGCLAQTPSALDRGSIHDLCLELPPPVVRTKVSVTEFSRDGSVPESEGARYLVGLRFLGLDAQGETRLRGFLDDAGRKK